MDDDAFVHAFLAGALSPSQFHHRDHLRLAWVLIRRRGLAAARATITSGLRHYAAAHDQGDRYHETITQFWVGLVGHLMRERPEITDFDAFLVAFPHLLDKGLPGRHWQQDTQQRGPSAVGGSGSLGPTVMGDPRRGAAVVPSCQCRPGDEDPPRPREREYDRRVVLASPV